MSYIDATVDLYSTHSSHSTLSPGTFMTHLVYSGGRYETIESQYLSFVQLLLRAPVFHDGFQMMTKILLECNLTAYAVLSKTMRCLMRNDQLNRALELHSCMLAAPELRMEASQHDQVVLEALAAASPQQKRVPFLRIACRSRSLSHKLCVIISYLWYVFVAEWLDRAVCQQDGAACQ